MHVRYSSLGSLPFKIVSLCSDTERNAVATAGTRVGSPVLEAYQAHSAIPAGCSPTRQIGDSLAAASSSGTGRSRKGPIWRVRRLRKCNVGWELACCESSVRVRCHGAASCSRATIQVFFAECPPSDGEEHCSRTGRSRCELGGKIHGAQSL